MKLATFWAGSVVLTVAATLGTLAACDGCNATSAQVAATVQDVADETVCVLKLIFMGVTNPDQLITCGQLTYKLVAQIIDDALTPAGAAADAGAIAAATAPMWTPQQVAQLQAARLAVVTKLAAQQSGK